jgi:hypothetical protein
LSALTARARLAGLVAHRDPGDPEITEARRDLAYVKLEQHIKREVDKAPPFTPAQVDSLTLLLRPAARAGGYDDAA